MVGYQPSNQQKKKTNKKKQGCFEVQFACIRFLLVGCQPKFARSVFARGICCTTFVQAFVPFKILNLHETIGWKMMCHSINDQTWWYSLMFWLLYVSSHNSAESTMVARRVSFFAPTCTKKKTFSHQNTKGNATKWSHKIKHSLYMRNSSKFIHIDFSVSAMCYRMSLQGMQVYVGK